MIRTEVNEHTSHVVVAKAERTLKVMQAIARGIFVVKPEWITESKKQSKWLDPAKFEASDWFPGAKKLRTNRLADKPLLLADKRIYIGTATGLSPRDLASLVQYSGGQIVSTVPQADIVIGGKRPKRQVVVADGQLLAGEAPVVKEEWLFDALSKGKLPDTDDYVIEIDTEVKSIERAPIKRKKKSKTKQDTEKIETEKKKDKQQATEIDTKKNDKKKNEKKQEKEEAVQTDTVEKGKNTKQPKEQADEDEKMEDLEEVEPEAEEVEAEVEAEVDDNEDDQSLEALSRSEKALSSSSPKKNASSQKKQPNPSAEEDDE